MAEKKTSEAQLRASKKWQQKNKEKMAYTRNKSASKKFISIQATEEDLNELEQLINSRRKDQ